MSEHKCRIDWARNTQDFNYETYNREHTWMFDNGVLVHASAAPAYKGNESCVDPEEALVAAASSCHMLTFLAIACKKKLVINSYSDQAVGHLKQNADGKFAITEIFLHPKVEFAAGTQVSREQLQALHESAHTHCFIANSISSKIEVVL